MLKQLFGSRPTTKFDVISAIGLAVIAVGTAVDRVQQYKTEHDNSTKENDQ